MSRFGSRRRRPPGKVQGTTDAQGHVVFAPGERYLPQTTGRAGHPIGGCTTCSIRSLAATQGLTEAEFRAGSGRAVDDRDA